MHDRAETLMKIIHFAKNRYFIHFVRSDILKLTLVRNDILKITLVRNDILGVCHCAPRILVRSDILWCAVTVPRYLLQCNFHDFID